MPALILVVALLVLVFEVSASQKLHVNEYDRYSKTSRVEEFKENRRKKK
jgi:uncharacterized membrane protein